MAEDKPKPDRIEAVYVERGPDGSGIHTYDKITPASQGPDLPNPQPAVDSGGTQASRDGRDALQLSLTEKADQLMKVLDAIEWELPAIRAAIDDQRIEGPGEDIVAREFGKIEQECGSILRRIMYLKFLCK